MASLGLMDYHKISLLTPYVLGTALRQRLIEDKGASYYVKASHLTAQHYQTLMDRGWRRSGQLLYLPDNRRSCCPHYTIRLPAVDFRPSRDQRQTINRWNRFILGPDYEHAHAKRYPKSKAEKKASKNDFSLCAAIHASEADCLPPEPKADKAFHVTLESDAFTEEKYSLFEKYQRIIHKEPPQDISKSGFRRFLCSSPLPRHDKDKEHQDKPTGSFHQTYRIDGTLFAFSVLDLLPTGVSAVYFVYDPAFEKHGLGKLSALRETALAHEKGYGYYYMGYYIHGCSKMRYKGDFKPQEVLDMRQGAEDMLWRPLDGDAQKEMTDHTFGLSTLTGNDEAGTTASEALLTPTAAAKSKSSLLTLNVPGVLPTSTLLASDFSLGEVLALIGPKSSQTVAPMGLLNVWQDDDENDDDDNAPGEPDLKQKQVDNALAKRIKSYEDSRSVKGAVAELVAAVGLDVARGMVVDFGGD